MPQAPSELERPPTALKAFAIGVATLTFVPMYAIASYAIALYSAVSACEDSMSEIAGH